MSEKIAQEIAESFNGRRTLDKLLDIEFEVESSVTLAGFMMEGLQRLPKVGEKLAYRGYDWTDDAYTETMGLEHGNCASLSRCCRTALNGAVELGAYDDPVLMRPYRTMLFYCPECGNPLVQYPSRYSH